ncbi:MAG TPA: hypothetical protein VKC53_01845 [Patescibacteria group bacterium]|nr:hypothetical protein [Patescibacteria group bacterium]
MDTINTSVCVRCGKARIVLSTNEEKIGNSIIVTTETICPDPDCQKKVDGMLSIEQEKRHASFLQKQNRMNARKPVKSATQ